MILAAYCSNTTCIICFTLFAALKLYARSLKSKLELSYDKSNKFFNEFLEKSSIRQLEYEPFILAPGPVFQGIFYLAYEKILRRIRPTYHEQELVKMPDGGTCGLEWLGKKPDGS